VGDMKIPQGSHGSRTLMYNIDDPQNHGIGAVRACGKAGDRNEIACTPWTRSKVNCNDETECAATAMMQFYDVKTGLWKTTGWWNSANALTAIIDYSHRTGKLKYSYLLHSFKCRIKFNVYFLMNFVLRFKDISLRHRQHF